MATNNNQLIVLAILDGWGLSSSKKNNAIHLANTPCMDTLSTTCPKTSLQASGRRVGLPKNQVGNSEVGHATIGGGRVIRQDLVRINSAIRNKTLLSNTALNNICKIIKQKQTKIHLIGLCSNGGVHSHTVHLLAILNLLKQKSISKICIHFITDGRDTQPDCAKQFIDEIENYLKEIKVGKICTISGRYYAMDRDCRWPRTEAFYRILTQNQNIVNANTHSIVEQSHSKNVLDEFIIPTRIRQGTIQDNDGIIFFNFRPDRMKQLIQVFTQINFKGFKREKIDDLSIATMTTYDSILNIPVCFPRLKAKNFLGEIIAKHGLKQFRIAETEKYAHVTYFLNGGREEPFLGEDRKLIASPKVQTYDQSPNMSSQYITQGIISAIEQQKYTMVIANYANPDMIGHTGNLEATIKGIEFLDSEISKVIDVVHNNGGILIITADHGNAECMLDNQSKPCKSHTTNPVPFLIIDKRQISRNKQHITLKQGQSLADIGPTILDLLDIDKPNDMTGDSIVEQFV